MKKRRAFIWLVLAGLVLSLVGCGAPAGGGEDMSFQTPQILSSVSASQGAAGETLYAEAENFSLYIDEQKAAFAVTDEAGHRWSSIPAGTPDDPSADELLGLVQVHYADQMGNTYELNSMTHSVRKGAAQVMRIENGARIEFSFPEQGLKVPVHITLCRGGVEISVIMAQIEETNPLFRMISVDVAPYFHAAESTTDAAALLSARKYSAKAHAAPAANNTPAHSIGFFSHLRYRLVANWKQMMPNIGSSTPVRMETALPRL